jgi:hypothetical protein
VTAALAAELMLVVNPLARRLPTERVGSGAKSNPKK